MRASGRDIQFDLKQKKVLVVGIARSGIAVANFLDKLGADVTLTDSKPYESLKETLANLENPKVQIVAGDFPEIKEGAFDYIIVSPGVPLTIGPLVKAKEAGIPIISEIELAYRYAQAPIVAITGTNGKTTTTTLVGELFRRAGKKVLVGGNIGLPLVSQVEDFGPEDVLVVEVSSFQLETVVDFKPKVGTILNLTPDHLDRHGNMENYLAAKCNVYQNQSLEDFTVLNYDDDALKKLADEVPGKVIFFSRQHKLEEGVFILDGQIHVRIAGRAEDIIDVEKVGIKGKHNLENAMAATAMAWVMGVSKDVIANTLESFQGVAHRMEFVAEINGVRYINDSKGTNPDASIKAIDAYHQPVILIAGGYNKSSDFTELAHYIKKQCRACILLGTTAEQIKETLEKQGFTDIKLVASMEEAVQASKDLAQPGDVVLLSPACASWDMFKDFEERGDIFKKAVIQLRGE